MTKTNLSRQQPDHSSLQKKKIFDRSSGFFEILFFLSRRLAFGLLILLFIIFLSYLGLDMAGGTELGKAFWTSLPKTWAYIVRLLNGDMGLTTAGSNTLVPRLVTETVAEFLPRSLGLLGISLSFSAVVGILLGVLAARSSSRRSLGILTLTLVGVSIPSFFAAFLLQWAVTAYTQKTGVRLLPVGGIGWDKHLILPALVLAARPVVQITRITFLSISDALQQDYVRTARGKGLRERRVMFFHILRNVAIPVLTTIGISLRFSLSSLPIVEYYFGWTGVGFALLKGIAQQDNNLTIALTLCMGILFILVNIFLDLSYRFIDPRLQSISQSATRDTQKSSKTMRIRWANFQTFLSDSQVRLQQWLKNLKQRVQRKPLPDSYTLQSRQAVAETSGDSSPKNRFPWKDLLGNFPLLVGGAIVLGLIFIVFFGSQITPHNPYKTQGFTKIDGVLSVPPFAPSETHPWGTDLLGRDMLSLILSGAQQTLMLGFFAVAARVLVGVFLGAIAGWNSGGRLDRFILSLVEIVSAFPTLLLGMILILAFGIRKGLPPFIIALCFVGWGEIMQFVRSEVIAIRPKPFIEGAVAVGARTPRILIRHVFPNVFTALISIIALEMGAVLMLLGELGFISIFIGGGAIIDLANGRLLYADVPEWGSLLSNLRYQARSYPWTAISPMSAFFISILGFNLLGEGIRRLVEQGNLIINRVFNKYTVVVGCAMVLGVGWLSSNSGAMPFYQAQARAFDAQQALLYTSVLTNPALEGRALGSHGMEMAAHYIAAEFESLGLQAAGEKDTYFQNRTRGFEQLLAVPSLQINDGGPELQDGIDFAAYPGLNMTHGVTNAPIRFVGLGQPSNVQVTGWRTTYPNLEFSDFSGEILLTLSDREATYLTRFAKAGMLVVVDNPAKLRQRYTLSGRINTWSDFSPDDIYGNEIPSLWISEGTANRLLAPSRLTVDDLREINNDLPIEADYQLPLQTEAKLNVRGIVKKDYPVQNVLGYIPGSWGYERCVDCLDTELIVVMAQYDAPPIGPNGEIYPAANNNASGVAIMLEAIRVLQETDYQPYRSFLFVAYSGEGLDGGEPIVDPDASFFLQAKTGFSTSYDVAAIVRLRGLGAGTGERLEISAEGSLHLADLLSKSADQMGVNVTRSGETVDIGVIYDTGNPSLENGQDAPTVKLYWEGWEEYSRLPTDRLEQISQEKLEEAGRTLAMSLMIMGAEREY